MTYGKRNDAANDDGHHSLQNDAKRGSASCIYFLRLLADGAGQIASIVLIFIEETDVLPERSREKPAAKRLGEVLRGVAKAVGLYEAGERRDNGLKGQALGCGRVMAANHGGHY